MLAIGRPSSSTITSPSRTPARSAGLSRLEVRHEHAGLDVEPEEPHDALVQRHVLPADAEECPLDVPVADQPGRDELRVSAGIAKQMPCAIGMIAVFTPITSPRLLTSGPPELPGLSARRSG